MGAGREKFGENLAPNSRARTRSARLAIPRSDALQRSLRGSAPAWSPCPTCRVVMGRPGRRLAPPGGYLQICLFRNGFTTRVEAALRWSCAPRDPDSRPRALNYVSSYVSRCIPYRLIVFYYVRKSLGNGTGVKWVVEYIINGQIYSHPISNSFETEPPPLSFLPPAAAPRLSSRRLLMG
jgi:hypothetical protein